MVVAGRPSPSCRVWERCICGMEVGGAGVGAPTARLKCMVAWYLRRSANSMVCVLGGREGGPIIIKSSF